MNNRGSNWRYLLLINGPIQARFILVPKTLRSHMILNPLCSHSGVLDDPDNHHNPIQQRKHRTATSYGKYLRDSRFLYKFCQL